MASWCDNRIAAYLVDRGLTQQGGQTQALAAVLTATEERPVLVRNYGEEHMELMLEALLVLEGIGLKFIHGAAH